MSTTYPTGYGRARVSLDELKRRWSDGMEPEFARRLFNWIESKGGAIGIGEAWRTKPHHVTKASRDGKSFHQTQTFADGSEFFTAVDLVVPRKNDGHAAGAVPVSLVPLQGSAEARTWGVHVNVGRPGKKGFESWHMQPVEIDGFGSWVKNGRPRPVPGYSVPGGPSPVVPPVADDGKWPRFSPEFSEYSLYPLNPTKSEVSAAVRPQPDDTVRYLQGVLRNQCRLSGIDLDGFFDDDTEHGVRSVQGWNGLEPNGRCDAATWKYIDDYATST